VGLETLPGLPEGVVAMRRGDVQVLLNFNEGERRINLAGEDINLPGRDVKVIGSE
jgi:hypothetical protein